MKKWEDMSSVELGALLQRLYLRLERYDIQAGSLMDCPERDVARLLSERMRADIREVSDLLDRRLAEASSPGAHTQALLRHREPPRVRAQRTVR
jgi:hypothetical protein